ncbi:MAG: endonuclease III [Ignavibacteriae bacterium HGW-Ignavibacteriae-3]|nr:MAG: endonuclease III [Ignavibacteriae bacterium HGW-Ignavibacteriae-3]
MKNRPALIQKVNQLLIKKFGIPMRSKKLPDPLDLLIATILSQNTNDNNSYKAFQNLKDRYKSWIDLNSVKRTELAKIIRIAGLANQKSAAIKNLIGELRKRGPLSLDFITGLDDHSAIEQLINYKGVGVKTASCVLLFAMNRNVCPVDTHVHRTVNRVGIVSEKTPDKTYYSLNEKFPDGVAHSFHTNLIRLGREICKPSNPNCAACPLLKLCEYKDKNLTPQLKGKEKVFMLLDSIGK